MCKSGAVNTIFVLCGNADVCKIIMYINDACNFISTHQ